MQYAKKSAKTFLSSLLPFSFFFSSFVPPSHLFFVCFLFWLPHIICSSWAQGSYPSFSLHPSCSFGSAGSLNHCVWPGIKPLSRCSQEAADPVCHRGTPNVSLFLIEEGIYESWTLQTDVTTEVLYFHKFVSECLYRGIILSLQCPVTF